jgi:DNA-binding MarR family transcriptional regulator
MSQASPIRTLGLVLQEFRIIEPDLPASYAAIIVYVARFEAERGESPSVGDISNGLGMARPAVSRATLALSSRRLGGNNAREDRPEGARKALGILERAPDDIDLRMMRCTLTAKGRALLVRLIDHLTSFKGD